MVGRMETVPFMCTSFIGFGFCQLIDITPTLIFGHKYLHVLPGALADLTISTE